ncbi:hypothetical protein [Paenibacillus sp. MMO-58]|uniref:hypothetical protein n=1 Tax=Paenibacillus sp. MMO-58 TaxID=3081290 RepID=UPI003018D071
MYEFFLFLHLTAISIWLGSVLTIAIMLLTMRQQIANRDIKSLAQKAIRTFNRIMYPSSFLVLVSGIVMIVKLGKDSARPFWLEYMQDAGAMTILVSIILSGIWGKKVIKRINQGNDKHAESSISKFSSGLLVSLLFILSVVFMAAFKFN